MKHIKLFVLLFTIIAATACAKKSADTSDADSVPSTPATPKALASTWTNGTWTINLLSARTDGVQFTLTVNDNGANGGNCSCPMTMTGTDSSGTCTEPACTWNHAGSDPGCGTITGHQNSWGFCYQGHYTKTSTTFTFDNSVIYH